MLPWDYGQSEQVPPDICSAGGWRMLPTALLNKIDETLAALHRNIEKNWRAARADRDGPYYRVVRRSAIIRLALEQVEPEHWGTRRFASEVFDLLKLRSQIPVRRGGILKKGEERTGVRPWDEETLEGWLAGRKSSPSPKDLANFDSATLDLCEGVLARLKRQGNVTIKDALDGTADPANCLAAVLGSLCPAPDNVFVPRNFPPSINDSLRGDPKAIDPDPLIAHAHEAIEFLRAHRHERRMVIVKGRPHSGKKTLLRYFLSELADDHLVLSDGSRLPVLGVALDDFTSVGFVDLVYSFYSSARVVHPEEQRLYNAADPQVKLERIAQLARDLPACVVIADVAPIDADPIVRALAQDHVGEVLFSILGGDVRTRVIVTAPSEGALAGPERQGIQLRVDSKTIDLPRKIRIDRTRLAQAGIPDWLPLQHGAEVSALTLTLAKVAMRLIDERRPPGRYRNKQRHRLKIHLEQDRSEDISCQIWEELLTAPERMAVGLIASSHDGLRLSTLGRMLKAFTALTEEAWGNLQITEETVAETVQGLRPLIRDQPTDVEEPLLEASVQIKETTFTLDDGWRRQFVQAWFNDEPHRARLAQWLISREAAAQSRRFRVYGSGRHTIQGLRRDIQALFALLSSIDPSSVESCSQVETPPGISQESLILPPLEDEQARMPDATLAIRYAFLQLYKGDLIREGFRHAAMFDDANLRLSVLLPIFDPQHPWARPEKSTLSRSLGSYRHLTLAFEPAELLDLLVSVALTALRCRRPDIVCAACRLGESLSHLAADRPLKKSDMLLLLRAEIDAALLSGGNPDAFLTSGAITSGAGEPTQRRPTSIQVTDVADRIVKLLDTQFAGSDGSEANDDLMEARGKLKARLGEAWHVAGYMSDANAAFEEAWQIDQALTGVALKIGPVLGGRGARSYLRLLLDQSRRDFWRSGVSVYKFPADGLMLPIPARIDDHNPKLIRAKRLFELNARRLGRGRASDSIGAKIDAARLAALQHDFAVALSLLEAGANSRFSSGASIEVLLELMAVRTRIEIDATVLCLIAAGGQSAIDERRVRSLATYLKQEYEGPADCLQLSTLLFERARAGRDAVARYVKGWGTHHPYFVYSVYLLAWEHVISSRIAPDPPSTRKLLDDAYFQLDIAIRHMREAEYRMHLIEARRLLDGLRCARKFAP